MLLIIKSERNNTSRMHMYCSRKCWVPVINYRQLVWFYSRANSTVPFLKTIYSHTNNKSHVAKIIVQLKIDKKSFENGFFPDHLTFLAHVFCIVSDIVRLDGFWKKNIVWRKYIIYFFITCFIFFVLKYSYYLPVLLG